MTLKTATTLNFLTNLFEQSVIRKAYALRWGWHYLKASSLVWLMPRLGDSNKRGWNTWASSGSLLSVYFHLSCLQCGSFRWAIHPTCHLKVPKGCLLIIKEEGKGTTSSTFMTWAWKYTASLSPHSILETSHQSNPYSWRGGTRILLVGKRVWARFKPVGILATEWTVE